MDVHDPAEFIKVLLDNPSSRSALSSFIEQTVSKSHVSILGFVDVVVLLIQSFF